MSYDMDWLLKKARDSMSSECFRILLMDHTQHHAPGWHDYGVLGHAYSVIEAARSLKDRLGIDVVAEAVLHDAGKFQQFPLALVQYGRSQKITAYRGHEILSAQMARTEGLSTESALAIELHGYAYQKIGIEKLASKLRSKDAAIKWMVLCAADAAGKGFPSQQEEDRKTNIPDKIAAIACFYDIDPQIEEACCEAVEEWQGTPPPKFR